MNRLTALLALLFLPLTGQAASFNCAKATTLVETAICANPRLSELDELLAQLYKEALSKDPSIRSEQIAWMKTRNQCRDEACLLSIYESRIGDVTNFIVRYDRQALAAPAPAPSKPAAQSHCSNEEITLFSCRLKKQKTVSVCASTNVSANAGYLQYRFGRIGQIELVLPPAPAGSPDMTLTRSKASHAEYNDMAINNGAYTLNITSFRRLSPTGPQGHPVPPDSHTLSVIDNRKSMREGNFVFNDECTGSVTPLDAAVVSRLTGKPLAKGGF
jgi:uncharacterized protein